MSQVDLHIHTTASDGRYSPCQIVAMATKQGMRVIAITDHDATDGVAAAQRAAERVPLQVIPAVEVNADFARTEVHILGYHVDCQCSGLQRILGALRDGRLSRARRMVDRLSALGLRLDWERVAAIAGDGSAVGRPHVAQALLEQGYVDSVQEAFTRYIGRGGPAYIERFKLSPMEAIRVIQEAGGIPVLAHPLSCMDIVAELVPAGLAGLEAYYTGYSGEETRLLLALAEKHALLVTGGSDFHGGDILPEAQLGGVEVPFSVVESLSRHQQAVQGGHKLRG